MVKVREDQPLKADGSVDVELWLENLSKKINIESKQKILDACQLANSLEYKIPPHLNPNDENYYVSASPFITGLKMADLLAELGMDEDSIMAAILYRFVRLHLLDLETIETRFGETIAKLIKSTLQMMIISKLQINEEKALGQQQTQMEQMRKMLVSLIDDVRVALIKIAERCVALRLVKDLPQEKQFRVAKEVKEIYAPLAHRLGVGHIKWEMEDLSFRYLHPNEYKKVAKLIAEKRQDRTDYIERVVNELEQKIKDSGIEGAQINGRAKHIYSIWRKMQRKNLDFSEIYDIRAVRVLVPETSHCYAVLGIVHSLFKHIPKEFDDYIANPKVNGYKSLHTAVIGPENKVLEIQIRTYDMHDEAELGVCAHWVYKGTDVKRNSLAYEEKISWLRQVLEWHDELGSEGIVTQIDFDTDRIYVFTPEGHIINLDKKSTPIDFAYKVHTQVGHKCKGAKVNGKIVPLTYKLKMGDRVEILTGSTPMPSRDWLNPNSGFAFSPRTRNKVHSWFKQQDRDKNLKEGKSILEKELKRLNFPQVDFKVLAEHFNLKEAEDLFVAIGAGDIRLSQVISASQNLFITLDDDDEIAKLIAKPIKKGDLSSNVTILGVGNLLTSMASCCNPLPGDDISGYITNGRGVSVHKSDCKNLLNLATEDANRVVDLEWGAIKRKTYPSDIKIEAWNRSGLLRDVTTILANEKIAVLSFKTETRDQLANLSIRIETANLVHLSRILSRLNQLPNVLEVYRASY